METIVSIIINRVYIFNNYFFTNIDLFIIKYLLINDNIILSIDI